MGDVQRVSEVGRFETDLPASQALATAGRAIDSVGRVNLSRAHIIREGPLTLTVEIRPTSSIGMLADDTQFTVDVEEVANGTCEVVVRATHYAVYQDKFLWLIPAGPRVVPGAKAYSRCLRAIAAALDDV